MIPQTLSVRQAAEHFHVKPRTVRNWIAIGRLPASRVGKSYFIQSDAILTLLEPTSKRRETSTEQTERLILADEFMSLLRGPKVMDKEKTREEMRRELEFDNAHTHTPTT